MINSVVIIQVAVSAVAIDVTVSSSNFVFLSLELTPTFHKIDWKTFKDISSLPLTTFVNFVNILSKLRYFLCRNYIQIGLKSHSVLLFS